MPFLAALGPMLGAIGGAVGGAAGAVGGGLASAAGAVGGGLASAAGGIGGALGGAASTVGGWLGMGGGGGGGAMSGAPMMFAQGGAGPSIMNSPLLSGLNLGPMGAATAPSGLVSSGMGGVMGGSAGFGLPAGSLVGGSGFGGGGALSGFLGSGGSSTLSSIGSAISSTGSAVGKVAGAPSFWDKLGHEIMSKDTIKATLSGMRNTQGTLDRAMASGAYGRSAGGGWQQMYPRSYPIQPVRNLGAEATIEQGLQLIRPTQSKLGLFL